MSLHKIKIAKELLETAMELFFSNKSPYAVIALAAASEEVLGNYSNGEWTQNNIDNIFHKMYEVAQKRNMTYGSKKFSQTLVNVTKNALKHANFETEQTVSVKEDEPVIWLLRALVNYQLGSGLEYSEIMNKFESWVRVNRPSYLYDQ